MWKMPDPDDLRVGARIRRRRNELGLSQTELAKAVGVTFQQIYRFEKGINRISASQLRLAAGALGVPPGFFLDSSRDADVEEIESKRDLDDEIRSFLSTKEGVKLNKAYIAIRDENVRRSIIILVQSVAATCEAMTLLEKPIS